jgi:hypothetical protein
MLVRVLVVARHRRRHNAALGWKGAEYDGEAERLPLRSSRRAFIPDCTAMGDDQMREKTKAGLGMAALRSAWS